MIKRNYYSVRTGKATPDQQVNFEVLKKLFSVAYKKMASDGYFQKYFGIDCPDGYISGELGEEIEAVIFVNIRKDNVYPIHEYVSDYTEDDLFDIIEFLHDHCSKGSEGYYHDWQNCGHHYKKFDDNEGKTYFREQLNPILKEYKDGFEISENGEIFILSDSGLSNLFDADVPTDDKENILDKINLAILKFRRYKSSMDDRREVVRELADVLEFLKPLLKEHLNKKDESDIFNIANNFAIRHHNKDQQTDYDKAIWCSWMFYFYLATIHAVLRMIDKNKNAIE